MDSPGDDPDTLAGLHPQVDAPERGRVLASVREQTLASDSSGASAMVSGARAESAMP
jgi:hypothetical protein